MVNLSQPHNLASDLNSNYHVGALFIYVLFPHKESHGEIGYETQNSTLADVSLDASIEMLQIADSLESNIGAGIEACITRLRTIDVKGVAGVVKKLESYRKGVCVAQEKIVSNVKKTSVIGNVSYAFHRRKKAKVKDPLKPRQHSKTDQHQ